MSSNSASNLGDSETKGPFYMPDLKNVPEQNRKQNADARFSNFEWLYDIYAPQVFGFITKYTDTKEETEEYMINVFLKVWDNIETFDGDEERKIQKIVLMICKRLYQKKLSVITSTELMYKTKLHIMPETKTNESLMQTLVIIGALIAFAIIIYIEFFG